MNIDYGSRIRAVCDYFETVPGKQYKYVQAPSRHSIKWGIGCVLLHGFIGGGIPESQLVYDPAQCEQLAAKWLGFEDFKAFADVVNTGRVEPHGEIGKQDALKALRDYVNTHYPVTAPIAHTGIPDSVLQLFETQQVAA